METKVASCNFTKYIKRGPNRWQHCPVVRGKTGRVKQDLVLVDGCIEQHPEGRNHHGHAEWQRSY